MLSDHAFKRCELTLFWLLLIVIAWLPIPLGSNRVWSWSLMELLIFTLASCLMVAYLAAKKPVPGVLITIKWPLMLLGIWLIYQLAQAILLPIKIVSLLSPVSIELRHYFKTELFAGYASISLNQGDTLSGLLQSTAYTTLFLVVITLVNSRKRIKQMAALFVIVGLAEALFGFVNYFTKGQFGYFRPAVPWDYAVTGTYVNRNHFAGLMEMVIPLALGLLIAQQQSDQFYPNLKARLRGWMEFLLSWQSWLYLSLLVMFAALLLSTSRGGNISLIIALLLSIILFKLLSGGLAHQVKLGRILILLFTLVVGWFGVGNMIERLDQHGLENSREAVWSATGKLISDYTITGSGAGSYEWVFPFYKTVELKQFVYDHAHNDYLELLAEQGVIGFLLLAIPLLLIISNIILSIKTRRNLLLRGVIFGVLCGAFSMLIHSAVDFNFHIPSNAAYFWCLLGMGVSAGKICRKRRSLYKKNDA